MSIWKWLLGQGNQGMSVENEERNFTATHWRIWRLREDGTYEEPIDIHNITLNLKMDYYLADMSWNDHVVGASKCLLTDCKGEITFAYYDPRIEWIMESDESFQYNGMNIPKYPRWGLMMEMEGKGDRFTFFPSVQAAGWVASDAYTVKRFQLRVALHCVHDHPVWAVPPNVVDNMDDALLALTQVWQRLEGYGK